MANLASLADSIKEVDRKVSALFDKIDKLCDIEDGPIVKQGKKLERHDTMLKVVFSILTPTVVALIIAYFKMR